MSTTNNNNNNNNNNKQEKETKENKENMGGLTIVCGPRGSGKTSAAISLISDLKLTRGLVYLPAPDALRSWVDYLPVPYIWDGNGVNGTLTEDRLHKILQHQMSSKEPSPMFLCLDTVQSDPEFMKLTTKPIFRKQLIENLKTYRIHLFWLCQYSVDTPRWLWDAANECILCPTTFEPEQRRLAERCNLTQDQLANLMENQHGKNGVLQMIRIKRNSLENAKPDVTMWTPIDLLVLTPHNKKISLVSEAATAAADQVFDTTKFWKHIHHQDAKITTTTTTTTTIPTITTSSQHISVENEYLVLMNPAFIK
jgi:hypothetical protein